MIRRCYIDNGSGGQIHLAETGQGEPILFLHQTPRSWDEFREVLEQLSDDFYCIAMDLPGMGQSSSFGGEASIENYAAAVVIAIEHLDLERVTVCGHHTGGVVAIELTASRSDLVSGLIISSTPWIDADTRQARAKKSPIDSITVAPDGSHLIDLWEQRQPYYPASGKYMNRFMRDAIRSENPVDGHLAVGRYEMENSASQIDSPILIVEHSDDPFASAHTSSICAAFPNADFKAIPDGKVPLEVTADQFSKIVKDWMRGNIQNAALEKTG